MKYRLFNFIILLFSIVTYCNACAQKCLVCTSTVYKKHLYTNNKNENECIVGVMKSLSHIPSDVSSDTCSVCGMNVVFTFDYNQNESLKNLKYDMIQIHRKCATGKPINYNCALAKPSDNQNFTSVSCGMVCVHNLCNNKPATLRSVEKILKNCAYCKSRIAKIRHNNCLNRDILKEQLFVYCKTNCFVKLYFSKNKITLFERGCTSNNHKNITKKSKILELKSLEFNGNDMLISSQCIADIGIACNYDYSPHRSNSTYDSYLKTIWMKIMKNVNSDTSSKCVFCKTKRRKKSKFSDCEKGINLDAFRNFALCNSKCYTKVKSKGEYINIEKGCMQPINNSYVDMNIDKLIKNNELESMELKDEVYCITDIFYSVCIKECSSKTEYCNLNTIIVKNRLRKHTMGSSNNYTNPEIKGSKLKMENIFERDFNKIEVERGTKSTAVMIGVELAIFAATIGMAQCYLKSRKKRMDARGDPSASTIIEKNSTIGSNAEAMEHANKLLNNDIIKEKDGSELSSIK